MLRFTRYRRRKKNANISGFYSDRKRNRPKGFTLLATWPHRGFTLIELLAVIAVIGLLSTLAVIALNSARIKSRDSKRLSDMKEIKTALEIFANGNNGLYPITSSTILLGDGDHACLGPDGFQSEGSCSGQYINLPKDPSGGYYAYYGGGYTYVLTGELEGTVNMDSGSESGSDAGLSGVVTVTNNTGFISSDSPMPVAGAPVVGAPASASASTVSGTTTTLSVLADDDGGESNLIYTWSTVSKPAGASDPTFSPNATNAAKNTEVTFFKAGNYTLAVAITDSDSHAATSTVSLTVNQTLVSVSVSPASATVNTGGSQQFTGNASDQFGDSMSAVLVWDATFGSINASGLFSAPVTGGNSTVNATGQGNVSGSASVLVNPPPSIAAGASASPSSVNGDNNTTLSVLGADDGGESNLIYTWSVTSKPGGASDPTFSQNGTNAAKSTVATFTMSGSYTFNVAITDTHSAAANSSVSVSVTLNTPPTIATAASASPSTITGTNTTLSTLGADDGGESSLIYTWSTVSKPEGASDPSFSANGTNAAKSTVATFSRAGAYSFRVTVTDGYSATATSDVSVTVNQTVGSVTVSPGSVTIITGNTQTFSASAVDQFGDAVSGFAWSVTGSGSIDSNGIFTAPSNTGTSTVLASVLGTTGSAAVSYHSAPPTVATAAAASPSPVTGTNTTLSVLGADDKGESALTYTWSIVSKPSGASDPTFSRNGTNAAKSAVATFSRAGSYTFRATIRDADSQTVTSNVSVTVNQTYTSVTASPGSANIITGNSQTFSATARDQFNNTISGYTFTWSLDGGGVGGSVNSSGVYTAPDAANVGGTATVRATSGSRSGTATVMIACGSSQPNPSPNGGTTYNYPTVQIGSQCWFRGPVYNGFLINSSVLPNTSNWQYDKWCAWNQGLGCTYGGYYTWAEGNQTNWYSNCDSVFCNVPNNNQGICPSGWHVASVSDVNTLNSALGITYWGMDEGTCYAPASNMSSYFDLLTGSGYRSSSGTLQPPGGGQGYFWAANGDGVSGAYAWRVKVTIDGVRNHICFTNTGYKVTGYSIRCVKN